MRNKRSKRVKRKKSSPSTSLDELHITKTELTKLTKEKTCLDKVVKELRDENNRLREEIKKQKSENKIIPLPSSSNPYLMSLSFANDDDITINIENGGKNVLLCELAYSP